MEVLRLVFDREEHPATTAVCARVCRSWHNEAAARLWRGSVDQMSVWRTPPCEALVRLAAQPKRFIHYIKHVQHLVLLWEEFAGAGVPGLFEPDLWIEFHARSVTVDIGTANMLEESMILLLSPQLRFLFLFGGLYQKEFVKTLADRAPQLRWVLLDNHEDVGTRSLWEFLQKARHLEALEITFGINHVLQAVDVMALILDMNLLVLDLGAPQDMREHDIPVFPSVSDRTQDFSISSVQVDAFGKLLALFPSVKRLNCSISGDSIDFFKQIFCTLLSLKSVSDVSLTFKSWAIISFERLDIQAALHGKLKQLEISVDLDEEEREQTHRAPTGTLATLTAALPNLEVLLFDYPCDLHDTELRAIAINCPQLRELSVAANVDLVHIFEGMPESGFQRLESVSFAASSFLDSGKSVSMDNTTAVVERVERLVRSRAPLLNSLHFTAGSEVVGYRFNTVLRSLNKKLAASARPRTTTVAKGFRQKLLESILDSG
ncbi:hypothetical protein FH972_022818 [Carpinus fangiana]|uniref:F-box domain-containing protein n=1 Tax=Carpinus fangiana TaxID=176857 RepID=A0A5N6KTC2_9ROSI|nr:hypothetical protein FH972_022818 [Carpinus fangiana]